MQSLNTFVLVIASLDVKNCSPETGAVSSSAVPRIKAASPPLIVWEVSLAIASIGKCMNALIIERAPIRTYTCNGLPRRIRSSGTTRPAKYFLVAASVVV